MKQCLIVLLRQHLRRDGEISPLFAALHDQRLARALVAVLDDPAARHTLESLARGAGMSRTPFAERFSQVFRQGPIDVVQKVRLRVAANLLATKTFANWASTALVAAPSDTELGDNVIDASEEAGRILPQP